MEIPEALRSRMNRPLPPAIDQVREFLLSYVAGGDTLEELRDKLARLARINQRGVRRDAEAIEALLATPQPPGTLSFMVAADANWVLEDETSDLLAADWLRDLATLIRGVLTETDDHK